MPRTTNVKQQAATAPTGWRRAVARRQPEYLAIHIQENVPAGSYLLTDDDGHQRILSAVEYDAEFKADTGGLTLRLMFGRERAPPTPPTPPKEQPPVASIHGGRRGERGAGYHRAFLDALRVVHEIGNTVRTLDASGQSSYHGVTVRELIDSSLVTRALRGRTTVSIDRACQTMKDLLDAGHVTRHRPDPLAVYHYRPTTVAP
jgi:hypothetical protein